LKKNIQSEVPNNQGELSASLHGMLRMVTTFLFPAYKSKLLTPEKENRFFCEDRFFCIWVEDGISRLNGCNSCFVQPLNRDKSTCRQTGFSSHLSGEINHPVK
jgi:hypothetical protein